MNALLTILYLVMCVGIAVFVPPLVEPFTSVYGPVTVADASRAVLLGTALALPAGIYAYKQGAVGFVLLKEKREERKRLELIERQEFAARMPFSGRPRVDYS